MAVVSSCREMLGEVPQRRNLTFSCHHLAGHSERTASDKLEEGGDDVKSSWPLRVGLHTCYNGIYNRKQDGDVKQILKNTSVRLHLQLECMKLELLVIVDQRATVNAFPVLYTPPVTPWSWFYLKARFKTLDHGIVSDWGSRNKVAGEPAAGLPFQG